MNVFAAIGRLTLRFFKATGHLFLFASSAVAGIFYPPFYSTLIIQQIRRVGYYSLPVVGLTEVFTGGVLALQIYVGSNRYDTETFVPQIVVLGITRELGPVRSENYIRPY